MLNSFILAIIILAVVNMPATRALELTKRSTDSYPNHGTITKDFAVINNGKKDSKQDMKKVDDIKDKDDVSTKVPDLDDVKPNLDLDKKRGINSPLTFIINNHERKLNERHIDNHRTPRLNIDNNSKALEGEKKPTEVAELKHASDRHNAKTSSKRKAKKAIGKINEVTHKTPLNRGSGNVIGTAHIVIPPQSSMSQYSSSNPFAPIDQLMKMANMLMFKVGMDTMSPYRTQSTQMAFTPNMLMSLRAPNSQHLLFDENRPNSDYFFNSIEGSQSSEFHPLPIVGNNKGLQSRTVFYAPPLIFKHPIPVDEPKQLMNLIENALGPLLVDSDNNNEEIDLTCPIHHEKKSIAGDGKCGNGDEPTDNDNSDGGVIQVCSCRLIKKGGNNNENKQEK